jgi:chromosome segregation ATPase
MLLKLSAFPHGLLIGIAVLALTSIAEAQRRDDGRYREIQQHEQRIRQAQQRLEALQREESSLRKEVEHLDKHLPKVRDQVKTDREELHQSEAEHRKTKDAVQAAKDAVKSQAKQLDELEAKIEAAQPVGSAYAKAKAASEATKTAYQKAVDEAEESPEYKAAYQEAMASENKATLLPAVRKKWLDEKPAVVESRQKMLAAKEAYENLREPLLAKNPEWIKASEACKKAKDDEQEASRREDQLAGKCASAKKSLARQEAEVKKMEATLEQARNSVRQLPGHIETLRRQIDNQRRTINRLR